MTRSLNRNAQGVIDIDLSVVNSRMNDIMKTLTVITAFFMPLAFITGFFGMNFIVAAAPLQAWTGGVAFTLILASMLVIPLIISLGCDVGRGFSILPTAPGGLQTGCGAQCSCA